MNKRDSRLDTIRGILLAIMTLNHLGVTLTGQPFGFVSAAEGFILLSAYTYAITSRLTDVSLSSLARTAGKRALKIYKYHILLFAILLGIALTVPAYGRYVEQLVASNASVPATIAAVLLFLHQPLYFDILPMYVVFSLLSPMALYAMRHSYGWVVVVGSVALWVAGNFFDPLRTMSDVLALGNGAGYFNVLSWQLLWVVGLYLGFAHKHQGSNLMPGPALIGVAISVGVVCLLAKYSIIDFSDYFRWYAGKRKLGILRILNVGAHLILLLAMLRFVKRDSGLPWFKFIGTYSLQVFTYHVFIIYMTRPLASYLSEHFGTSITIWFNLLVLATLTLPALFYQKVLQNRAGRSKESLPAIPPAKPS